MAEIKRTMGVIVFLAVLFLLLNMTGYKNLYFLTATEKLQRRAEFDDFLVSNHKNADELPPVFERNVELWHRMGAPLKPCWRNHTKKRAQRPWGYVAVVCSNGPDNHRLQIAAAVVLSIKLGATLILPIIKEAEKEPQSNFGQLYNILNFISTLEGVVRVVGRVPEEMKRSNVTVTRVPLVFSEKYITRDILPAFKKKGLVVLASFKTEVFGKEQDPEMEAIRCLVMCKALRFSTQIEKIGGRVVERMKEAARFDAGHFISVDFKVDMLKDKACHSSSKAVPECLSLSKVGLILQRVGFPSDTTIYVTQSPWDSSLETLQELFPNIHTKEYSIPFNEEKQFYLSGKTQLELAVDLYVCTHSDVFIPTAPSLFAETVMGQRIVAGLNQPKAIQDVVKSVMSDRMLKLATGKNHRVYKCFC